MRRVARKLGARCAYLEINTPSIPEAIDRAARAGSRDIRVLPYFLLTGRHVLEDIPRIILEAKKKHPKTAIRLCPYLGYDERIVAVARDRLRTRMPR